MLLGGALLTVAIAACARVVTRQLLAPEQAATLDHKSPFLKAHLSIEIKGSHLEAATRVYPLE